MHVKQHRAWHKATHEQWWLLVLSLFLFLVILRESWIHLPVLSWVGPTSLDRLGQLGSLSSLGINWQMGQEETTYLIVIWRPVPLKDFSSNLWRAFSHKWVVAGKELTNFHWKFPGRKRSPSFWNHPMRSSWKPSLLALRVSPSVYEGVSGKLVHGTKVASPVLDHGSVMLFA